MSQTDNCTDLIKDHRQYTHEEKLLTFLNVTSSVLNSMRQRGFPYIQIANGKRMYHLPEVCAWLKSKERKRS